ncbi:O-antigen ligase family protein [Gracilibacillus saliphilus]|uniref:O-antigen ligase family protein n=1 Tax=Gracilibacillus saliphilus TaxID=543890 RepID=UPI0013D36340|nr:O-antigen ligase family protein [Gracilibacillus saliphilus]
MGHSCGSVTEKDDKKISIALLSSIVILTMQYFLIVILNLMNTSMVTNIQLISKIIVGLVYLYALPIVVKRSKGKLLLFYFIFVGIFLTHYLLYPDVRSELVSIGVTFFTMALPSFIYALSLRNLNVLKKVMNKASLIVFILGIILGFLIVLKIVDLGDYSMALSYYMLLPALINMDELLSKFSIKSFIILLGSLIVILALGSRGAMICVVIFTILKLIKFEHRLTIKSFLGYSFILFGGGIVLINFEKILTSIYELLLNYGINSRSIKLFLGDDIHLSGRDGLYEKVLKEISLYPLLGRGIGSDRIIIGNGYVHNILLEILINFGVIIGSIIISIILLMLLKILFEKNNLNYNIYIIWIAFGFIHLMVSSSYWSDQKFWILLGLLVNGLFLKDRPLQNKIL